MDWDRVRQRHNANKQAAQAPVVQPATQEILKPQVSGQDLIKHYYDKANNATSSITNGLFNTANAMAAKDGYDLVTAAAKNDSSSYNRPEGYAGLNVTVTEPKPPVVDQFNRRRR